MMTENVLCALDISSHSVGYDNGSGIGGIAKYMSEFEEGMENYIELMVKDSELYMSLHGESETAEYKKLLTDTMMDVHKQFA